MQAHALTPRMVHALESHRTSYASRPEHSSNVHKRFDHASSTPDFPFLSVLASGGHTLLIHSASLTDHQILGSTNDIAIGECLDKIARVVLPMDLLQTTKNTMYGALLEEFAMRTSQGTACADKTEPDVSNLSNAESSLDPAIHSAKTYLEDHEHEYEWTHANHEEAARRNTTQWGWVINQPLLTSGGGAKLKSFEMSFSGLMTSVERIVRYGTDPFTKKLRKTERAPGAITSQERKDIAREVMRAAFEHVASRVVLGLQSLQASSSAIPAVVVAGGVAANSFFRYMQVSFVAEHDHADSS